MKMIGKILIDWFALALGTILIALACFKVW